MREQFRWLWANIKGRHFAYVCALTCTVIVNLMQLVVPVFSQKIIDLFLTGDEAAYNRENNMTLLFILVACMVGGTVLRGAIAYGANMTYEHVSQFLVYNLRTKLFRKVENQDMQFYNKYRTGDLMTRMTGDLDAIRHMCAWVIRMLVECIVLFTVSIIYYFYIDWLMAIIIMTICPIVFITMYFFRKKIGPMHALLREKLSDMNTATQENISGNRIVKAFAREEYEIEKFDKVNRDYSETNKETSFTWLRFFPIVDGSVRMFNIVLLLVGGIFIINGRISFGQYVAFSGLIWTLASPMSNLGNIFNEFQRYVAAAGKVREIYEQEPVMKEGPGVSAVMAHPESMDCDESQCTNWPMAHRITGSVEFRNVSFSYPDDKESVVLKNVSFKVEPGETVAIMGDTGGGKTSLIGLIPRFYDPDEGQVLVDGIDVRQYKYDQLRRNIGMATQDVLLYSDTIDSNIAYGNSKMSAKTVRDFATTAAVTEFVSHMPQGFDTIVGERGVGLSGGQKQRISLARALAIRPAILILDDTTSAVDMETEHFIQENLRNLDFQCTKIIIAQRISSTKDADKIIIIRDGHITEMGKHDELLAKRGYYYSIFALQNGLEEGGAV